MDSHTLDVLTLLDDVIRDRRGTSIFRTPGMLTNLGVIWEGEITKINDPQLATEAVAWLYANFTADRVPKPTDLRDVVAKLRKDRAPVGLPESRFVRDMPGWTKGWLIARYRDGDMRVWPQQKEGYDQMQREHPYERTYVWGEQEIMPPDERAKYEERGKHLTAQQIAALIGGTAA